MAYIGGSHISLYDLATGKENLRRLRENAVIQPEGQIDVAIMSTVDLKGTWLKIKDFILASDSRDLLKKLLLTETSLTKIHDSYMSTREMSDGDLTGDEHIRVFDFCEFADSVKDLPGITVVLGYDSQDPAHRRKAIAIMLEGKSIAICRLKMDLYNRMRAQMAQMKNESDVIGVLKEEALACADSMNYLVPQLLDRHFSGHSISVPLQGNCDRHNIVDAAKEALMVAGDFNKTSVHSEYIHRKWTRSSAIGDALRGRNLLIRFKNLILPYDFLMAVLGRFYPNMTRSESEPVTYTIKLNDVNSENTLPQISVGDADELINLNRPGNPGD